MAKEHVAEVSAVRPARDPAAPWAANASRQARESDGSREVVYCISVDGIPLVKIGRTTQLKRRMDQLKSVSGRLLHIAYWAEFHPDDARDIERCALLRMRRHFDSEGEWSLADPVHGTAAIISAAEFIGVRPNHEAGTPWAEERPDELAELRQNYAPIKHAAHNMIDLGLNGNPLSIRRVDDPPEIGYLPTQASLV